MQKNLFNTIALFTATFSLLLLEIFCAQLAFETLNEITSGLYFFIVSMNILPVILLVLNKHKQVALGIIVLLGIMIVPYQLYLGNKLNMLKEEAANITAYIYEHKINQGSYPKNLNGYIFNFPNLKEHFRYTLESEKKFIIDYYVGTETTSHFYNSEIKKWKYYPD